MDNFKAQRIALLQQELTACLEAKEELLRQVTDIMHALHSNGAKISDARSKLEEIRSGQTTLDRNISDG